MTHEYLIVLSELGAKPDLSVRRTSAFIAEQLRSQGRQAISSYRYEVTVSILEGHRRPSKDVDNYAKKAIDAITRSGLLWRDDEQIDRLLVTRKRHRSSQWSQIEIRVKKVNGQHSGVPSFFRVRCLEAQSLPGQSYANAGYHLAIHLATQQPYDKLENMWLEEINRLCTHLESENALEIWDWFCERFPKCMRLVPNRRRHQFVNGVLKAYSEGRLDV